MKRAKPRVYRKYSDDEKAEALATLKAYDCDLKKTSNELDIPVGTLHFWLKSTEHHPTVVQNSEVHKQQIADRLESLVHDLISVAPGKIDEASLVQVMTSVGIAVDKMRILREQPTQIQSKVTHVNPDELIQRIRELATQYRSDQTTQSDGTPPALSAP